MLVGIGIIKLVFRDTWLFNKLIFGKSFGTFTKSSHNYTIICQEDSLDRRGKSADRKIKRRRRERIIRVCI